MNPSPAAPPPLPAPARGRRLGWWLVLAFLAGGLCAAAATAVWYQRYFAASLQPVRLAAAESRSLEAKLHLLETAGLGLTPGAALAAGPSGEAERTLSVSGREINAFLAERGLGENFQVELARDLLHLTTVVPIPADSGLPLLAGTTLRVRLSLAVMADVAGGLHFSIRDVRLGGVPLPDAWLGEIKGVNLLDQNLNQDPAVQRLLNGIRDLEVHPDGIRLRLRE